MGFELHELSMKKFTICYCDKQGNDVEITLEAESERKAVERILNEIQNLDYIFDTFEKS